MNLWARRIGQLLLVAPFLFACKEDTSVLGFKNPNSKFNVRYVEIPIASSMYLVDSLSTSTFVSNGVSQFLIGEYVDPDLGKVTAIPQTRFLPSNSKRDTIHHSSNEKFDSAFIELRYTYNMVGSTQDVTPQAVEVFELTEALEYDSFPYYMNRSLKAVDPVVLGTETFTPDPAEFKKYVTDKKDTTIVLKIEILSFGEKLFNDALAYSNGTDPDSIYYYSDKFVEKYKGISIQPVSGDKIFGFSINDVASRIVVYYSAPDDAASRTLGFTFSTNASSRMMTFNHISANRTGSDVVGIGNNYYRDYPNTDYPNTDMRYSQSGIGIVTKLDFSNFFNFTDTIPEIISGSDTVPSIIINSAELVLSNIQKTGDFDPVDSYKLAVLKSNNRLLPLKTGADSTSVIAYKGWLVPDNSVARFPVMTPVGDVGSAAALSYSSANNNFSAFLSVFLQELSIATKNKTQYTEFALVPASIRINNDISRFGVHKDNIKLKIYYTIPTLDSTN